MMVVASSDLVVTLPHSIAACYTEALGLEALDPPLERAPFTTTVIWPDMLAADPGILWLKGVIREEVATVDGTIPLSAGRMEGTAPHLGISRPRMPPI